MASATSWSSPLHCRPLTSQSKLPTSLSKLPKSQSRLSTSSLPWMSRRLSVSVSTSESLTAVKPNNVQSQREKFSDDEDQTEKRTGDPSGEYANIVRFKGPYNVQIFVDENETEESISGRFRREVMREGILQECKRRRFHETRQDIKKRKSKDSQRRGRNRRALMRKREEEQENEDEDYVDDDDLEDNWELPEEDIGF